MSHLWHRTDLSWADAALDLRHTDHQTLLPDTLPAPVTDRVIHVEGWTVAPHVVPGGPKGGSVSVLVLEAPDGWRGGVVLTQDSGTKFAFKNTTTALPYLGRLLSPRGATAWALRHLTVLAAAGLPMLRSTITNPLEWAPDFLDDPDQVGQLEYYDLRWASSGVTRTDADVLEDYQLYPVDIPAAHWQDLKRWHASGWTDPHDVALWVQAGCETPTHAHELSRHGFTPVEAKDWANTPVPPRNEWAHDLIAAGWTPHMARRLGEAVNRQPLCTFFGLMGEWGRLMPTRRIALCLEAGLSIDEARRVVSNHTLPDDASLQLLGAWATEPTHWRVGQRFMGYYRP